MRSILGGIGVTFQARIVRVGVGRCGVGVACGPSDSIGSVWNISGGLDGGPLLTRPGISTCKVCMISRRQDGWEPTSRGYGSKHREDLFVDAFS